MKAVAVLCLIALTATVATASTTPKEIYDSVKAGDQANLASADAKCSDPAALTDADKAAVKDIRKQFVNNVSKQLKAERKSLAAAGAPKEERKPFNLAIQALRDYRKALDAGGDPCAAIPEIA